jgi:hypothetical protein
VADPSRHRLRAECIEAAYIAQNQAELIGHSLVPGELGQAKMKKLVSPEDC